MFGRSVTQLLQPGQHGSTYSGNPLATAVSLAVLDTLAVDGLVDHAAALGERARERFSALAEVTEVSGTGLLLGLELRDASAKDATNAALDAGFIVNPVTETRLRIAPPLIITDDQLLDFACALPGLLTTADRASAAPEGRP